MKRYFERNSRQSLALAWGLRGGAKRGLTFIAGNAINITEPLVSTLLPCQSGCISFDNQVAPPGQSACSSLDILVAF